MSVLGKCNSGVTSYIKGLTPVPQTVTVSKDKAFKMIIKLKWGSLEWALIQLSYKKKKFGHTQTSFKHKGTTTWRDSKRAVTCKSKREASKEISSASTLILDFQPPELWKDQFLFFNQTLYGSVLWQPELTKTTHIWRQGKARFRKCKPISLLSHHVINLSTAKCKIFR